MKNLLPGWKTNINTIVLALSSILGVAGIQGNPEQAIEIINEFGNLIEAGFGLSALIGVYFRQLGKRQ